MGPLRDKKTTKVTFTDRPNKGIAVRESHFKEPPKPKHYLDPEMLDKSIPLEERDPVWLKDKVFILLQNRD